MESIVDGDSIGTGTSTEQLAREIGLTAAEVRWRKEFVGFGEEDARRLDAMGEVVDANVEALVDAFLEPIHAHDRTAEILGRSPRTDDQIRAIVVGYLRTLTGGEYGVDHFAHRTRIGRLHDRLDMPLHYFGGMFANLNNIFLDAVRESTVAAATEGLDADAAADVSAAVEDGFRNAKAAVRGTNLDMQVINDTYLHSYSGEMRAEVERSRELRETVGETVEDLRAATTAAAESVDEIDALGADQSARMAELSGELSTLSAMVEEVAATADDVAGTSDRAEKLARDGRESASDAIDSIHSIGDAGGEIAAGVESLVGAIDEIEEIVEVIDEIAEQTNLLALNASIEAARAGEAGSGFAVVADEVKNLANESKAQAKRVDSVIGDVTEHIDATAASLDTADERIEEGIEGVETSLGTLDAIVEAVSDASMGIEEVAAATDEQAATSSELARTVDDAAAGADGVATEIERVSRNVRAQSETTNELDAALNRLRDADGDGKVGEARVESATGAAEPSRGRSGRPRIDPEDREAASVSRSAGDNWGGGEERRGGTSDGWEGGEGRTGDDRGNRAGGASDIGRTDGGVATERAGSADNLRDRLPEGMPDAVVDSLPRETLERVAEDGSDGGRPE